MPTMANKPPTAREVLAPIMAQPGARELLGEREGSEPADELEHFYKCLTCGQLVDMRDLWAVFHHEEPRHEPLPAEDAERVAAATRQLRAALKL